MAAYSFLGPMMLTLATHERLETISPNKLKHHAI
jgi:hypothetical protein